MIPAAVGFVVGWLAGTVMVLRLHSWLDKTTNGLTMHSSDAPFDYVIPDTVWQTDYTKPWRP